VPETLALLDFNPPAEISLRQKQKIFGKPPGINLEW
jgi:hypothetical protein